MITLGKIPTLFVKVFLFTCILYFGFITYGVIKDIDPSQKKELFIPLNDASAEYSIDCQENGIMKLRYHNDTYPENKISSNFIGSSPVNLEQFCNQKVIVTAQARNRAGVVLCTQEGIDNKIILCTTAKTAVVDIISVSQK